MHPYLSIIVPIYNAQSYLRDCLDSIWHQSYTDWVCLLVNDGSTDSSQVVIDEYCAKDKRFLAITKPNEKSADLARKYAIDSAQSEWIMHIDADDVIVSDFVERMVRRQEETGADLVAARLIGCESGIEGEAYRSPDMSFDMSQVLSGAEACLLNIGKWTWSANAGVLYRKSLTADVVYGGLMNSDEFSQRLLTYCASKVAFEDVHYLYRANEGTSVAISSRIFDRTLVDMQLEEFVYQKFPNRKDKIKALTWQRLFNLIYLEADFVANKENFPVDEKVHTRHILQKSYDALKRILTIWYVPTHAWMTLLPYSMFEKVAYCYVRYKRNHGGMFFYR